MLLEKRPEYMAAVFDAPGKTFRHEKYPEYKAQRQETDKALIQQLPRVKAISGSIVATFCVPGVEADDVIATIATRASLDGFNVRYCERAASNTLDRIGSAHLWMLRNTSSSRSRTAEHGQQGGEDREIKPQGTFYPYSMADFEEEFSIPPQRFVDVLALAGDRSDNIRGVCHIGRHKGYMQCAVSVDGVGLVTGSKLVAQYGSLEAIVAERASIKGKRAREGLAKEGAVEQVMLNKKLVSLHTSLSMPALSFSWEDLRVGVPLVGCFPNPHIWLVSVLNPAIWQDAGESAMQMLEECEMKEHQRRLRNQWRTYEEYTEIMMAMYGRKDVNDSVEESA
eukprot:scaffold115_cov304-Prasinococcus_capsulatus_cf.AAC.57